MAALLGADDPEPSSPRPAGPLFVPVRPGPAGYAARLFRTPLGGRTAVAFTTEDRLRSVLGTGQPWIRLAEPALHALAGPLGVTALTVDPQLSAPAPRAAPVATAAARAGARADGGLRAPRTPAPCGSAWAGWTSTVPPRSPASSPRWAPAGTGR